MKYEVSVKLRIRKISIRTNFELTLEEVVVEVVLLPFCVLISLEQKREWASSTSDIC
jgi:hypothetical protein